MIIGVGIDLVDIDRVERMMAERKEHAMARLFTDAEAAYALGRPRPAMHLAARFAAKEAAFKALAGTDEARRIAWTDIEVVSAADGAPSLRFHGRAASRAKELGVIRMHISITHTDTAAGAVVVLEAP